ncbi:MAG: phage integrase N-terminal SAM-like domain-containing protein, partial [Thiotrichaceae bacterium]|nr:phage integrase N-terminal SAM-like domain-containing protein [Thiotrichaceae bacterium]
QYLNLQAFHPKTIKAYSRAIRRIGAAFQYDIEALTEDQLLTHFSSLLITHSRSTVKLDLYGLKFFYQFDMVNLFVFTHDNIFWYSGSSDF